MSQNLPNKRTAALLIIFMLCLLCPWGASPARADQESDPGEFVQEMIQLIQHKDQQGLVEYVIASPNTARTVFRNLLAAIETKIEAGESIQNQEIQLADTLARLIAIVFKGKMKDTSLEAEYGRFLARVKQKVKNSGKPTPEKTTPSPAPKPASAPQNPYDRQLDRLDYNFARGQVKPEDDKKLKQLYKELLSKKDWRRLVRRGEIIARLQANMGFFDSSIDVRKNTLEKFAPKLGDRDTKIRLNMRIGDVYFRANRLNQGEKYFRRVLDLAQGEDTPVARLGRAVSSMNLMCLYLFRGDEKKFTAAVNDLSREGNVLPQDDSGAYQQQDIFLFLRTLNRFYNALELEMILKTAAGNEEEGLKYLKTMLIFFKNFANGIENNPYFTSHPADMIRAKLIILRGIGKLAILAQRYSQARDYFAKIREEMKKFPKDQEVYEDKEMQALIILDLAEASGNALPDGKTDKAAFDRGFADTLKLYYDAFKLAKETQNLNLLIDGQGDLAGFLIARGNLSDPKTRGLANQALEKMEKLSRDINSRAGLMNYHFIKGRMEEKSGNLKGAAQNFEKSLDALEDMILVGTENPRQRLNVLKKLEILYKLTSQAYIKSGQPQKALQVMARLNRVVTVSSIDVSKVKTRDRKVQTALTDYTRLRNETREIENKLQREKSRPEKSKDMAKIEKLSRTLARTKSEFYQSVNRIRAANPDYARLVSVKPALFSRIQKTIPRNTALVQYLPTADTLYVFVVTREGYKIEQVNVSQEKLFGLVRRFRRQMKQAASAVSRGKTPDKGMKSSLTALYGYLIAPIENDLKNREVVAIIPTSHLYYLPFHALAKPDGKGGVRYLLQDRQVVYLTSLELYRSVTDKKKNFNGVALALGNPDGSLKSAGDEARKMKEIFPGAIVFTGSKATKDRVQNPPKNLGILHLATHGYLDGDDVNRSYILLAGAGDKSRLTQGEIFEIPLEGSTLVTLSACQTAVGERFPGSEIASLASAFSIAGSPSIVASLWPVSDNSTNLLMTGFYTGLKEGRTKGDALQNAQLKLLSDGRYSHPFYWAPFILMGDWR